MMQESKPRLVITEAIDERIIDDLESRLSELIDLSPRQLLFRKAADVPQYIQLVGTVAFWAPLTVAATAFLNRIAGRAADDVYDFVRGRFRQEKQSAIERISEALLQAKKTLDPHVTLYFQLIRDSNDFSGVLVKPESDDPILVATYFARLAIILESLARALDSSRPLLGNASVKFISDQQAVVEWLDVEFKRHSVTIDLDI